MGTIGLVPLRRVTLPRPTPTNIPRAASALRLFSVARYLSRAVLPVTIRHFRPSSRRSGSSPTCLFTACPPISRLPPKQLPFQKVCS